MAKNLLRSAGLIGVLTIASCQHPPPPDAGAPPPQGLAAADRGSGLISSSNFAAPQPLIEERTPQRVGARGSGHTTAAGDITLNFVDADIREVARTVLGQILKVNYTIDPNVHGTTTIETTTPLTRAQLLPTLVSLLNQNGATLVEDTGMYRVVPTTTAQASSTLVGAQNPGVGSELIPLSYASARELAKVLTPYVGDSVKILPDQTHNAIIVSGDPAARRSVAELIKAFDVDTLAGQSYALFPVSGDDPGKLADELQKALQTEGDSGLGDVVKIIPMERVNAILVISPQPRYLDDARRLFNMIQRARDVTSRSWHVYYVENGQAPELANLLQRAFTPGAAGGSGGSGSSASIEGGTAPGLDTATLSAPGGASSGGSPGGGASSGGSSGISGLTTPSALGGSGGGSSGGTGMSAATESLSPTSGGDVTGGGGNANTIRILADTRVNALLVYATAQEESMIESMLHKVDILPLQVRIDATIAEVTLNDNLSYGTQFFFKNGGLNGTLSFNGVTPGSIAGDFPGFVLSKGTSAVRAALSALQAVTTVRVLSSPEIMVLDNQMARLQVGDLVPYLSQTAVSTQQSSAPIVNSINYQQTGVILEVIPRVNTGGLVTLDIEQQVSDVATTSSSTINSPTFQQREVRSRVVIQDGQTVGLAGLIRDNASRDNEGVPYLKDVPVLGALFGQQTNTRTRTELLVMITPHVVQDQRSAWSLTQDLRAKLPGAAAVPSALQALPMSGSSNPTGNVLPP